MRRWCAALAFVPALAWGDCMSNQDRETLTRLALNIQDLVERNVSERELIAVADRVENPGLRAATYEAVLQLSSAQPLSLSAVVGSMQLACYDAMRH